MSERPSYFDELLDKASKTAGNDAKLAAALGVPRQRISQWRRWQQPCPPADQALMAHIAGLDAEAFSARALIALHEGSAKGEMLKQALKKALLATGGALGGFGAQAGELSQRIYTMFITLGVKARSRPA